MIFAKLLTYRWRWMVNCVHPTNNENATKGGTSRGNEQRKVKQKVDLFGGRCRFLSSPFLANSLLFQIFHGQGQRSYLIDGGQRTIRVGSLTIDIDCLERPFYFENTCFGSLDKDCLRMVHFYKMLNDCKIQSFTSDSMLCVFRLPTCFEFYSYLFYLDALHTIEISHHCGF